MSDKIESRAKGLDAITQHSMLVEQIANDIATTMGPKGMDKMIIYDNSKKRSISNDGAFIIQTMNIDHPVAEMLKEVARTQDEEVGDGTSTSIVLSGALLGRARKLRSIPYAQHPQKIIDTYDLALNKAKELYTNISYEYTDKDLELLIKTILTGKLADNSVIIKELANNLKDLRDKDKVNITTIKGSNTENLDFIKGYVIDKEIIHKAMPRNKKDAKILLLSNNLQYKVDNASTQFNINDPESAIHFYELEEKMSKSIVDKLKSAGVDIVLFTGSVSDLVKDFLAKEGITAIRRINNTQLEYISDITGAKVVSSIDNLKNVLGVCDFTTEKKYGEEYTKILSKDSDYLNIVIRGTSEDVLSEMKRGLEDVIKVVDSVNKTKRLLTGAGSCELSVANELRDWSYTFRGIEQLIIQQVAEALEEIPMILAMSFGNNQYELFLEARSKNKENNKIGIDVINNKISDMSSVIEPLSIKLQAIDSAKEFVKAILRIDHIIIGVPDLRE